MSDERITFLEKELDKVRKDIGTVASSYIQLYKHTLEEQTKRRRQEEKERNACSKMSVVASGLFGFLSGVLFMSTLLC